MLWKARLTGAQRNICGFYWEKCYFFLSIFVLCLHALWSSPGAKCKCALPRDPSWKRKNQDRFNVVYSFDHSRSKEYLFPTTQGFAGKMWPAALHSWLWRTWWQEQGHGRMAHRYFFVWKDQRTHSVRVQAEGGLTLGECLPWGHLVCIM